MDAKSRISSAARVVLGAFPAVVLLTMGYRHRWVTEDAFIDFRVVKHLLAGDGPVFNLGERVEAYSNPLWVALLALWGALGGRIETGAILFGLCLSVGGVVLAQVAAMNLLPGRDTPEGKGLAVPLGTAVVVAVPVFWDFATSGLETGLSFFWLGACSWLLARPDSSEERHRWASVASAIVLGLGPLVRPDLALFSVVFVSALLVRSASLAPSPREGIRRALALGAWSLVVPGTYQVFRMGYFAGLVPAPALAKEAGLAFGERGLAYACDLLGCYALSLPLGLLAGFSAVAARRAVRLRAWGTALAIVAPMMGALLHAGYVIRVGGDFMHGRLLLPAVFAFVLPVAAVRLPSLGSPDHSKWVAWGACAGIGVWGGVCAASMRFHELDVPWGIVDERGFYVDRTGIETPTKLEDYEASRHLGRALAEVAAARRMLVVDEEPRCSIVQVTADSELRYCTTAETDPLRFPLRPTLDLRVQAVLARANIGAIGYALGTRVNVVDRRGLSDVFSSRIRLQRRGRAGHEKMLPGAWLLARFTEPVRSGVEPPALVAAREALGCGELAELREATEGPLDVSRFTRNLGVAFRLHALRIPEDPVAARDGLCRRSPL